MPEVRGPEPLVLWLAHNYHPTRYHVSSNETPYGATLPHVMVTDQILCSMPQ